MWSVFVWHFSLWSLLLCIERRVEREEHLNRVHQGSNSGLANRNRIPHGRSPLAVAVVKVEKILRVSSHVSLRGKIPVLPAHTKADENWGALFLPGTGKDRRPQGGRRAQEGWKPHLLQTGLSRKLKLCINSWQEEKLNKINLLGSHWGSRVKLQHRAGNKSSEQLWMSPAWHSEGEPALCLSLHNAPHTNPRKEQIALTQQDPELKISPEMCSYKRYIQFYSLATALWACFEKNGLTKSSIQQLLFFVLDIISGNGRTVCSTGRSQGISQDGRNVLTGDLQLISNALQSIFGRVFLFCFLTSTQFKKKIILNWCTGCFSFSVRALVFRVRICASTLAKIFMAELGKRVKVKRQAVGSNKDQNH